MEIYCIYDTKVMLQISNHCNICIKTYFFYILNKSAKCKVKKMKNIKKLLNFLFQVLILLIIIDRAMSQCGIRWRGTCDTKSSATKRQML